jgi:gamma-butyrobetaine dioxygenase
MIPSLPVTSVSDIFALFEVNGERSYGEEVSLRSHSLQSAARARAAGATDALVAAALLHDIGHLLAADAAVDRGRPDEDDDHHEAVGARLLVALFGSEVARPVALHVQAKRWRCTVERSYLAELSSQSAMTLRAQGGLLDDGECRRFESHPGFTDAVELRRWDDQAKDPGATVPSLSSYRGLLESLVVPDRMP